MSSTRLEKTALAVSGGTAITVGALILATPHAFFASYGITLEANASLLSELRAPAAGLAVCGVVMLIGIWRARVTPLSKSLALIVFLAFPAGRVLGLVVDVRPSEPIIAALIFEIVVAALCCIAFGRSMFSAEPQISDASTGQ